jgi:hypothetical protein
MCREPAVGNIDITVRLHTSQIASGYLSCFLPLTSATLPVCEIPCHAESGISKTPTLGHSVSKCGVMMM